MGFDSLLIFNKAIILIHLYGYEWTESPKPRALFFQEFIDFTKRGIVDGEND